MACPDCTSLPIADCRAHPACMVVGSGMSPDTCRPLPPPPGTPGGGSGDVHLRTFDGLLYDFQGGGEFVMMRSTSGTRFEVQARFEPYGSSSTVSVTTAVALELEGHRIGIDVREPGVVTIDATSILLADAVELTGGVIVRAGRDDREIVVYGPTGEAVVVTRQGAYLNFRIGPGARSVVGMLGNFDGTATNDLVRADGEVVTTPFTLTALYLGLGESWRIDAQVPFAASPSLFTYRAGESTATFTRRYPSFPADRPAITAAARAAAEQICRARLPAACSSSDLTNALVETCIVDVAVTGDPAFAADLLGVSCPLAVAPAPLPDATPPPGSELCSNLLDDDHDGLVDEMPCSPCTAACVPAPAIVGPTTGTTSLCEPHSTGARPLLRFKMAGAHLTAGGSSIPFRIELADGTGTPIRTAIVQQSASDFSCTTIVQGLQCNWRWQTCPADGPGQPEVQWRVAADVAGAPATPWTSFTRDLAPADYEVCANLVDDDGDGQIDEAACEPCLDGTGCYREMPTQLSPSSGAIVACSSAQFEWFVDHVDAGNSALPITLEIESPSTGNMIRREITNPGFFGQGNGVWYFLDWSGDCLTNFGWPQAAQATELRWRARLGHAHDINQAPWTAWRVFTRDPTQ